MDSERVWRFSRTPPIVQTVSLCPQLWRSWGGILLSGHPSIRDSVRPLFYAWHNLWTVHGMVLISYMDSSWKNGWPVFFFLSALCPFLELSPFEKIRMKSCQQDISKSIWTRGLKRLIGNLIYFWMNSVHFFPELWPFENLGILNLSARYLETFLS